MNSKWYMLTVALLLALFMSLGGCAKKNVRHLASDVCLITPDKTTKDEVLAYLGQPDAQHQMADGSEIWEYYEEKKKLLHDTPYIGDKFGDKKYETVRVAFRGDIVKTCIYRMLTEEEFAEGGLPE